jgi:hypothetical protein
LNFGSRAALLACGCCGFKTELEAGLTLSRLALTSKNRNTKARNTANAQKAYDTAQAWAAKIQLSPTDSEEISANFERLAVALAQVAEDVSAHKCL